MKIKWGKSEEGYVESKCGRWRIVPLYCGTTSPQMYEIIDDDEGRRWTGDTQRMLKADAQDAVDRGEAA
jgi:hypothetical protein